MIFTDEMPGWWRKALLMAVGVVVVLGAFLAWMVTSLRSDIPETVTASSFLACGQSYELLPGYMAFDYGSRPQAEVPSGHTVFHVRSVEAGASAPVASDEIFASWPTEVSELVVGDVYSEWLESLRYSEEVSYLGRSEFLGGISYSESCRVSLHLSGPAGHEIPRPDDWAIVIYEVRGGDGVVGDDLEAWRSRGLTD